MMLSSASCLLTILTLAILLLADVTQSKFLSADLNWARRRVKQAEDTGPSSDLAQLLTIREVDEEPLLQKAMHVIDSVATRSTCHQAAAAQLLVTCKAVGKDLALEQGKHELLDRAKSVYAVRMSVCETGEGRAAVPPSCRPILAVPRQLRGEFEVVNSISLPPCLEALMAQHYYWTSYSNSRQDANTLCQAVTLESTKLEALDSYQRLAELLPEFRNDLLSTRSQWLAFVNQQEQNFYDLNKLQRQHHEETAGQHKTGLKLFQSAMITAKEGLEDVARMMQQSMASTSTELDRGRTAIAQVLMDFANLRKLLADTILTIDRTQVETTRKHAEEMAKVQDIALVTAEALRDSNAKELMLNLSGLFTVMIEEMNKVLIVQETQSANTKQQIQLSNELVAFQKSNLAFGRQLDEYSARLTSELESAAGVADQMSLRLNHVDQALGRVERASSAVSTVVDLITIPAQMFQQFHPRLFGIFAMPIVISFFHQPRRYSYIVITAYVFTESIISLIHEYRPAVMSIVADATQRSQSALVLASRLSWSQKILILSTLLSLFIWISISLFRAQKYRHPTSPRSSDTLKQLRSHKPLAEQRLWRNERRTHRSPDRFRRAATVC